MSYARLTVNGVWHRWKRESVFYLAAVCDRGSLLPAAGARLKAREELPLGAKVCRQCEAKEEKSS